MRGLLIPVAFLLLSSTGHAVFRFSNLQEPASLDPARAPDVGSRYILDNLWRGLLRTDPEGRLQPEGARACQWESSKRWRCDLDPEVKWSDGRTVVAADYVLAFQRLVDPATGSPHAGAFLALKNARAILAGQAKTTTLGVHSPKPFQLIFTLDRPDADLPFRLAHSVFAPFRKQSFGNYDRATELITNGPYKVARWLPGKSLLLKPTFEAKNTDQMWAEAIFVADDGAALRLYEGGELDLLRRVPTALIPQWKARPGFFEVPVLRFDYIGFGPELLADPQRREALALALDYPDMQKLFHSKSVPGCAGLPASYFHRLPCLTMNLARAKKLWQEAAAKTPNPSLTLYFSAQGGADHRRAMEWLQHQWKKNLGVRVELESLDTGLLTLKWQSGKAPLYRRGWPLDRATCLAVLEEFGPDGRQPGGFRTDKVFSTVLQNLQRATSPESQKTWCERGVRHLLDDFRLIPLGEISFAMAHNGRFAGWTINQLNQLDLRHLHRKTP